MTTAPNTILASAPLVGEIVTGFAYVDLSPDTAADIQAAATRIRARIVRHTTDIIETGADLMAVKARLKHGQFGEWLRVEFDMSETTARNYIRAAEAFYDVSATVAVLPPRAVYALASPSTPLEFRAKVVERLEAGESVDSENLINQTKEAQRADKEARIIAGLSDEERARRERNEKARARNAAKREEQRQAENAAWRERQEQRAAQAQEVAKLIVQALGDRREEVAAMIGDVDSSKLVDALKLLLR